MKIRMIVAMDKTNGIGYKNKLPWHFKEDLKFFSKITRGTGKNAVLMGKNTYLSLGKNLPKRDHLILSTSGNFKYYENKNKNRYDIEKFDSIFKCLEYCTSKNYEDLWIIGGSSVYKQCIDKIDIDDLYVTHIKDDYLCDCFFPAFNFTHKEMIQSTNEFDIVRYFN